ncbi:MAG TPA: hypothetical protein VE177_06935, partial [Candidatus Binatus sp.]|nr:hypothetical protein [Candidatus Binatus sp.]
GRITIGPSPTLAVQRNFTSTTGRALQSTAGRLTVSAQMNEVYSCQQAQPPCAIPSVTFQLYLTGPSRMICINANCQFYTRLFGFLYNSQTKVGLLFIAGLAPGDVDEDGHVDLTDLTIVGSNFGKDNAQTAMSQPCTASNYPSVYYLDPDRNGIVGISALATVGSNFGTNY